MPPDEVLSRAATRLRRSSPNRRDLELFYLVRHAHIFTAAVREILELKLLQEVTRAQLTLSQFHLLKLMVANGKHQLGEVAGFLGVSPPAATKNIDKLEGLGLVARLRSSGDRRTTLLSVSPKGRRLVRQYERLKRARLKPVLARFRPAEIEQLTRLLERFSVSLLSVEKPGDGVCLRCAAYIAPECPVGHLRGGCPYRKSRGSRLKGGAGKGVWGDQVPLDCLR